MEKTQEPITKRQRSKSRFILTSILFANMITGCQTTESKRNREIAHVISKQEILIDALVAERVHPDIKARIGKSKTLTKAEGHLNEALNALRQSCKSLEEVVKNEQHERR